MPLSNGTRLGPYEILAPIGAGGMGEVYRARDTKLDREVAIKVLPPSFAQDPERLARFEREAKVLAALNHPNIAQIYGVEDRALVMELVPGESIKGPLPLETALNYAKQIAEALEAAHEKGIVHRDLKPANILVTPAGVVKVLDFGLASVLNRDREEGDPANSPTLTISQTRAGMILGTAAYMSPEQARGKAVDKRADIWAFGVVLYEMLTGKRLFDGETVSDALAHVLTKEPDWEQVPAKVRRLLEACLQKDPKQRLQAIGDWRLLLTDVQPQVAAPSRSRLGWVTAGVAIIAIIAGAGWWRATRPVSQPLIRLSLDLPEFALTPNVLPGASVALSPDGRRIVYTGRGTDGAFRLYTRTLDQEQSAPLAGTEDAYGPFFSPDGRTVGFFASGKLKKISLDHGQAVALCDVAQGWGGSWSDDGNIIWAANDNTIIRRIPSDGGSVEPVTKLKVGDSEHGWPQVLPGAQEVLFTALPALGSNEDSSIEVQSLRTGERKTLVRGGYFGHYAPSGHLLYMHQGTLYAAPLDVKRLELTGPTVPVIDEVASDGANEFAHVNFSQNGTLAYVRGKAASQKLVWMDGTGQTQPLRVTPAQYKGTIRFSPDGKRLAMGVLEGGKANIWVYEWARDIMTRLTFTDGFDFSPVWSTDGKHIVFASSRHRDTRGDNLYWMRADGAGEALRLTASDNDHFPFSLSPDGKHVAFLEKSPKTGYDLWTLPLEDIESGHPKPGKPEPFLVTPFNEDEPMISPDGRWLAYISDESGRNEVYVRPFPGPGGKWQISTTRGVHPVWSKKSPELFYQSGEGVMVASYTTNGEAFVASKPRLWAEKKDLGDYFDLAPDGKRFAVVQAEASEQQAPPHVTLLLNFFDELRRRVPAGAK